jgi:hypothetical protein
LGDHPEVVVTLKIVVINVAQFRVDFVHQRENLDTAGPESAKGFGSGYPRNPRVELALLVKFHQQHTSISEAHHRYGVFDFRCVPEIIATFGHGE